MRRRRPSAPTATCCSSRPGQAPTRTLTRRHCCGDSPRPAGRPPRNSHWSAGSTACVLHGTPTSPSPPPDCWPRRSTWPTTRDCARSERRPRSRRSTPTTRCATGTTTSARPSRTCCLLLGGRGVATWGVIRTGSAHLTPAPGGGLRDAGFDVSRDGSFVVTSWQVPARCGSAIAPGPRRRRDAPVHGLLDDSAADLGCRRFAGGSRWRFSARPTPHLTGAPRITLCLFASALWPKS